MTPTLELRKWARTAGDRVLFHIYLGDQRIGTGSMRSRDWFEVERGNFKLMVRFEVEGMEPFSAPGKIR